MLRLQDLYFSSKAKFILLAALIGPYPFHLRYTVSGLDASVKDGHQSGLESIKVSREMGAILVQNQVQVKQRSIQRSTVE